MKKFITLIVVVVTLLSQPLALADIFLHPPKVGRVAVVCAHAVDCVRAMHIFEGASKFLEKEFRLRLIPVAVARINHDMTGNWDERVEKWQIAVEGVRAKSNAQAVLVFISQFPTSVDYIDFEEENVLGIVNRIAAFGDSDALAIVKMVGSDKVAGRITLHELGHLLGAWHTPGLGIMAGSAQSAQHADSFAPVSIKEILHFVAGLP